MCDCFRLQQLEKNTRNKPLFDYRIACIPLLCLWLFWSADPRIYYWNPFLFLWRIPIYISFVWFPLWTRVFAFPAVLSPLPMSPDNLSSLCFHFSRMQKKVLCFYCLSHYIRHQGLVVCLYAFTQCGSHQPQYFRTLSLNVSFRYRTLSLSLVMVPCEKSAYAWQRSKHKARLTHSYSLSLLPLPA